MEAFRLNRQVVVSAIPLLAIFASASARMFFVLKISQLGGYSYPLMGIWLILQFIFATGWGFLSDYFSRKAILSLCIIGKMAGLLLIFGESILSAIIIDGIFGNINPVARAAYCDVHISQKRVPNIINTFLVQPIPWILFSLFSPTNFSFMIIVSFLAISLILVFTLFIDFRDRAVIKLSSARKVFRYELLMVALAFLLMNSQWWVLLHILEQRHLFDEFAGNLFLINGISFFLGAFIARMLNLGIEKSIVLIFFLIFSTILLNACFSWVYSDKLNISVDLMLHFTLLGGIGQPLIYGLFGKGMAVHEQGTAYGLLESVQFLSEILWVGFLTTLKAINLEYCYAILISISALSLILTWAGLRKKLTQIKN